MAPPGTIITPRLACFGSLGLCDNLNRLGLKRVHETVSSVFDDACINHHVFLSNLTYSLSKYRINRSPIHSNSNLRASAISSIREVARTCRYLKLILNQQ